MNILLVEDDRMIGGAVRQALEDAGHTIEWVTGGHAGASALLNRAFQLVLLDIRLPGRDGLSVLREARARGDATPIIVLTARDSIEDRIEGLDLGADDYLVKPFHIAELLARIRAVSRRRDAVSRILSNGSIDLDIETKCATVDGHRCALSRREFAMLKELLTRPGAVLSRSDLEARIYDSSEAIESNAIDFIIHGLRKKLGAESVVNVRGLGWTTPDLT